MTMTLARPLAPRRQPDDRGLHRPTAQKRLMIMMLLYGAAVVIVLSKLAFFAVFAGPASANTMAARAMRGDIVDRNGAPLARTIDAWAIGVHPEQILGDKRDIAQRLAGILGLDENKIYGQLTGKNFAYIERDASASLVTEVNAIGEPAIVFEREPQVPPELFTLDNVVMVPHIASSTVQTREAMAQRVMENLAAFFAGETMPSLAQPA